MLMGMKIYSDFPLRRTLQIAADALALLMIAAAVWAGVLITTGIATLAEAGRRLEEAGTGFQGAMADAADVLGGLPLFGDAVRTPFDAASDTGHALANAGSRTEDFILTTAGIVGAVVATLVVVAILWVWLRRRVAFIRRASEAGRLSRTEGGDDILALRALASASSSQLANVGAQPVGAWRSGDAAAIRTLAQLELRGAGVRARASSAR